MCERSIAGWGRRKIVADLVARRVDLWFEPTRKRPKPVWNESYVQKILTGGEACSDYRPSGGEAIQGYYPAAVDRATFELARSAAVARKGGGGEGDFKNLFQNPCRCGVCGNGMNLEDKGSRSGGPELVCRLATSSQCVQRFRYDYQLAEITIVFGIGRHADKLVQASQAQANELRGKVAIAEAQQRDAEEGIKGLVKWTETNDDEALDEALRGLRADSRRPASEVGALKQELAGAAQGVGPNSPHNITAFYERLRAVPEGERSSARNQINQGLRLIGKRIVFLDGKLRTEFIDWGTAWADVSAKRSPRPNPGQFSSVVREGRQLRRDGPGEAWAIGAEFARKFRAGGSHSDRCGPERPPMPSPTTLGPSPSVLDRVGRVRRGPHEGEAERWRGPERYGRGQHGGFACHRRSSMEVRRGGQPQQRRSGAIARRGTVRHARRAPHLDVPSAAGTASIMPLRLPRSSRVPIVTVKDTPEVRRAGRVRDGLGPVGRARNARNERLRKNLARPEVSAG